MKKVLFVALLLVAVSAVAFQGRQDPDAVPTASEVFRRVMSPFCPGVTLYECTSSQAAELRSEIGPRIAGGATNAEIDRWLTDNYGEAVLARPRSPWVWAPPAAGVLIALALVTQRVRGKREVAEVAEISESDRSRLDEDLRRFGGFGGVAAPQSTEPRAPEAANPPKSSAEGQV